MGIVGRIGRLGKSINRAKKEVRKKTGLNASKIPKGELSFGFDSGGFAAEISSEGKLKLKTPIVGFEWDLNDPDESSISMAFDQLKLEGERLDECRVLLTWSLSGYEYYREIKEVDSEECRNRKPGIGDGHEGEEPGEPEPSICDYPSGSASPISESDFSEIPPDGGDWWNECFSPDDDWWEDEENQGEGGIPFPPQPPEPPILEGYGTVVYWWDYVWMRRHYNQVNWEPGEYVGVVISTIKKMPRWWDYYGEMVLWQKRISSTVPKSGESSKDITWLPNKFSDLSTPYSIINHWISVGKPSGSQPYGNFRYTGDLGLLSEFIAHYNNVIENGEGYGQINNDDRWFPENTRPYYTKIWDYAYFNYVVLDDDKILKQNTTKPSNKTNKTIRMPGMDNNCCGISRRIWELLGGNDFPLAFPDKITVDSDSPNDSQRVISNYAEAFAYKFDIDDERWGQFDIQIEIEDSDPTTESNQSETVKLPNLAESIAEIVGLLYLLLGGITTTEKLGVHTLQEVGLTKLASVKTGRDLEELIEYIGYECKEKEEKINLNFNPEGETFDELLQGGEQKIKVLVNNDKHSLEERLEELLKAAKLIRTVFSAEISSINPTFDLLEMISNKWKHFDDIDELIKESGEKVKDEFKQQFPNLEVESTNVVNQDKLKGF